jgi:hypothetical protein
MSRNINVNPGHYKVAGRERQGEAIHQSSQKGAYTQQRQEARREAIEFEAGPPAWETTPPNLEIPDRSRARRKSRTTRSGKRTPKAASTTKTGRVKKKKAAGRSPGASTKARRTRRARA